MNVSLPLDGRQILVVEDQYLLARHVCEWLEAAGAEIIGPAPDSRRACELLDDRSVDGAVVDINLGNGPTYEIASRLAERKVPFIFATGYDQAVIPAEFEATPRIEKPFRGTDLVRAVQALKPA